MKRIVAICMLLGLSGCGGFSSSDTVASITISPSPAYVAINGTQQLTATAKDADGKVMTGVSFTWASSTSNVATISNTGLATGIATGKTQVTASANGVTSPADTLSVGDTAAPQWLQTVVLSCNTGGTGAQCATTVPVNVTAQAGNTILLAFWYNSFPTTVVVSDSNNDKFSLWAAVPTTDLNDSYAVVYAATHVVGGPSIVNLSFSGTVPITVYGAALEYTGVTSGTDAMATSDALLTSQQQGDSFGSGNFSTHLNNELVFGLALANFGVQNNGWTPRVGCTPQTSSNSGYFCFEETTSPTEGSFDATFITDFQSNGGIGNPPSPSSPNGYGVAGFSIY